MKLLDTRTVHVCELLEFEGLRLELAFPGEGTYQRWVLRGTDSQIVYMQAVAFCPGCGKDCRSDLLWRVPGKPAKTKVMERLNAKGLKAKPSIEALEGTCAVKEKMGMNQADKLLDRIAYKLEAWAEESRKGGWSTHQEEPQKRLAVEIRNAIMTGRYEQVLIEGKQRKD